MTLPDAVRELVDAAVGTVRDVVRVGGGDTSTAARVETAAGAVFVKWGRGAAGETYAAEADGLSALAPAAAPGIVVPVPLARRAPDADGPGALVLPWLRTRSRVSADWYAFGRELWEMHSIEGPGEGYGWPADNWIGSKPQRNGWHADWPTFFGERRLRAQAETVRALGGWDASWDAPLDRLIAKLPALLPAQPERSLLHGDLWAGNALAVVPEPETRHGSRFALIDPAVYVGDRVADLAMMELFGGFGDALEGYFSEWPNEHALDECREIYALYHLINHLTHGPQYRAPVEATLRRFGA